MERYLFRVSEVWVAQSTSFVSYERSEHDVDILNIGLIERNHTVVMSIYTEI